MIDRIHAFRAALQDGAAEQRVPATHGVGLFCAVGARGLRHELRARRAACAGGRVDRRRGAAMEDYFHKRVIVERADARTAARLPRARLDGRAAPDHGAHARAGPPCRHVDGARGRVRRADRCAARGDGRRALGRRRDLVAASTTRSGSSCARCRRASSPRSPTTRSRAYCEVRSDGTVAQIEDVNTLVRFRGRGLGRAVVQHALDEARSDAATSSTSRRWPTTGRASSTRSSASTSSASATSTRCSRTR